MIQSLASMFDHPALRSSDESRLSEHCLLLSILALGLFGVIMIASASAPLSERIYGTPFYFVQRQLMFLAIGLLIGALIFRIPLIFWERTGPLLMIISLFFLALVLVPGIGKSVNGSRRWIDLGLFTVQVSEAVKLFTILYLAGYLVRRGYLVQTTFIGFAAPLFLMSVACILLLLEPDFGAAVVIVATATLMLFVAGVRFSQFLALGTVMVGAAVALIYASPYRARRLGSFLDPFDDPFNSDYQLSNSLIAIGSGGITGSGLGSSIQKYHYLPEPHTDFLFAILSEELGLLGVLFLIGLYAVIVGRAFILSSKAEAQGQHFAGYVALGIGIWIGLQSFINIGVCLGALPTKGITLPLMSYGGSSAVIFAIAFSVLLRVEWELKRRRQILQKSADILSQQRRQSYG